MLLEQTLICRRGSSQDRL